MAKKKRTEEQRNSILNWFRSCEKHCKKAGIKFTAGTNSEVVKTALCDDYENKTKKQKSKNN